MASLLRKIFRRKKKAPLVCSVALGPDGHPLNEDPGHVHTAACFVSFEPLAVLELFQSQGCAACPKALPAIHASTAAQPNLLVLTFPVTLFDHLGWKDTLATPAADSRQRAYVIKWSRTSISTPHLVVNGVVDASGAQEKADIEELVDRARGMQRSMDWHIYVDANDTHIRIDSDKPVSEEEKPFDITVVVYKTGDEIVKAGKGPNKGKKIPHRNVVQNVMKVGEWAGGDVEVALPTARSAMQHGLDAVVIVQLGGAGGPIVGATKL